MSTSNAGPKILGLETSTGNCSVSILAGNEVFASQKEAGQQHSSLVLPMIDELMQRTGLKLADLDAVAFGAGPGSFTGLRIACGVAQGLAFAINLPCIPVGSLEALAQASEGERIVVCTDARMGQVYHAAYERDGGGWQEILPPTLCDPGSLPELPGDDWLGCGSGFERYPQICRQQYRDVVSRFIEALVPHAREVVVLAAHYLETGRAVSSADAAPVYVRNKVALTMKEQG
ncbi:MAG: tRNA (adenosine(37)-N6)-threonylcarbamoyltransferase complex dimerization subunit type 1 TsaB [Burkholderiales bacterium]